MTAKRFGAYRWVIQMCRFLQKIDLGQRTESLLIERRRVLYLFLLDATVVTDSLDRAVALHRHTATYHFHFHFDHEHPSG
jgi:hypothetical protein